MQTSFTWVGGRPSVDFTATLGKRQQAPFERIPEPADLGRWFQEAGLAQVAPQVSRAVRGLAVELREALYRLFSGTALPADVGVVNRWSSRRLPGPRLTAERSLEGTSPTATDLLGVLARDGIDLLTGPLGGRIRTCAADDCSLLFVDASRAGRRRWCSMNTCGARAKMATYRSAD
ncbi:putative RNA-binding Zn ribbon-like protein [Kribbella aluminosa]|uniref:RNA-binding Zn ribbon-like protein n=1 Tax=Kribbella aluminosa TaxID=416017 RepID=A0ABS4UVT5_9ACTN|nr:ABATE domain-containing protein [Kribbella aluminosa]MBP2355765.1 putative RNA-binding Zn ribbon-like protein [Kribbella aluminosa]